MLQVVSPIVFYPSESKEIRGGVPIDGQCRGHLLEGQLDEAAGPAPQRQADCHLQHKDIRTK